MMITFPSDSQSLLQVSLINVEKLELYKKKDLICSNEEKFKIDLNMFVANQLSNIN